VAVLVVPGVDGKAVLDEAVQPRLIEFCRRERVERGYPRQDHSVVDNAAEVVLRVQNLAAEIPLEGK
jgi:hypothetical protein